MTKFKKLFDARHGVKKRCLTWHRVILALINRCHVRHRFLTPCLASKSCRTLYVQSITQFRQTRLQITIYVLLRAHLVIFFNSTAWLMVAPKCAAWPVFAINDICLPSAHLTIFFNSTTWVIASRHFSDDQFSQMKPRLPKLGKWLQV